MTTFTQTMDTYEQSNVPTCSKHTNLQAIDSVHRRHTQQFSFGRNETEVDRVGSDQPWQQSRSRSPRPICNIATAFFTRDGSASIQILHTNKGSWLHTHPTDAPSTDVVDEPNRYCDSTQLGIGSKQVVASSAVFGI